MIGQKLPGASFLNHSAYRVAYRHHHKRWNGYGYPDRLTGEDIPIESRIVAILDPYNAMTSDRAYPAGLRPGLAISVLLCCSDAQFDPRVVTAFLKIIGFDEETIEQPLAINMT